MEDLLEGNGKLRELFLKNYLTKKQEFFSNLIFFKNLHKFVFQAPTRTYEVV